MANLAIKGHATRSEEVIQLLEMLGGKNIHRHDGKSSEFVYVINSSYKGEIDCFYAVSDVYKVNTLEQFLEKFPYKVGDKVNVCGENAALVIGMRWESDYVLYRVRMEKNGYETSKIVEELQPYTEQKEESMEMNIVNNDCDFKINTITELCDIKVITFANCNLNEVEIDLADKFEIVLKDGKYYAVRKQPQYPKTYEECCKVLGLIEDEAAFLGYEVGHKPYKESLIISFQKLLICRDAYWKIAGEQMGLGKPWEPDYENPDIDLYVIINIYNRVEKAGYGYGFQQCILTFPTEEMRDNFFENFKELIEECKELL